MYGVYAAHFLRGIATLTLAMTRKFNCLCERSEAISREGGFLQSIFFSLWSWDISLTLNMTCLIPYRRLRRHFPRRRKQDLSLRGTKEEADKITMTCLDFHFIPLSRSHRKSARHFAARLHRLRFTILRNAFQWFRVPTT